MSAIPDAAPPSYEETVCATAAAAATKPVHSSADVGILKTTVEKLQSQLEALNKERPALMSHLSLAARTEASLNAQINELRRERDLLVQAAQQDAETIRKLHMEARTQATAKSMATRDFDAALQRLERAISALEGVAAISEPMPISETRSERLAAFDDQLAALSELSLRRGTQSAQSAFRLGVVVGSEETRRSWIQEEEGRARETLNELCIASHNEALLETSFDVLDEE